MPTSSSTSNSSSPPSPSPSSPLNLPSNNPYRRSSSSSSSSSWNVLGGCFVLFGGMFYLGHRWHLNSRESQRILNENAEKMFQNSQKWAGTHSQNFNFNNINIHNQYQSSDPSSSTASTASSHQYQYSSHQEEPHASSSSTSSSSSSSSNSQTVDDMNSQARVEFDEYLAENHREFNPYGNRPSWQEERRSKAMEAQERFLRDKAIGNKHWNSKEKQKQNENFPKEFWQKQWESNPNDFQNAESMFHQYQQNNSQWKYSKQFDFNNTKKTWKPSGEEGKKSAGFVHSREHSAAKILLGLDAHSPSIDQVKFAFKSKALITHPDVAGGSEKAFQEVQSAYNLLMNSAEKMYGKAK